VTEGEIERCHPWPAVEERVSSNNTILSEGRGWRERYKARQGADLRTIFVALAYVPVSFCKSVKEHPFCELFCCNVGLV
jgi:hypothetical protein